MTPDDHWKGATMRRLLLTTCLTLGLTPAWADDAALVVGIERYERLDRLVQGTMSTRSAVALERAGFQVFAGANLDRTSLRQLARSFHAETDDAGRLVVALTGRFTNDGETSWLLASDAGEPMLFSTGDRALSLNAVMNVLATSPGQALLLIGEEAGDDKVYDGPVKAGIGPLDVPQGVTVIRGRPGVIADLLATAVAEPGTDVLRQARRTRGIRLDGYLPSSLVVTPVGTEPIDGGANSTGASNRLLHQRAWDEAVALDSAQGFLAYLARFPNGPNVEEARARLAAIRAEPFRQERLAEEALGLSRAARRAIQRDLNVLDYNTRGIDGIFGPGTRQAITNWQQQTGRSQTGYLTANQIFRLDAQASRRAAELEAIAERQRKEEERRDRAFWEETGLAGTEAGYRTYLNRYPDGVFAREASARLEAIEASKRERAAQQERTAWDRARQRNTPAAYRAYLDQYPNGSFVDAARARIQAAQQNNSNANQRRAAENVEKALGLDPITIRLIEARLQQMGLEPGTVDGRLDGDSRRAIRRYQRDRNLERTGYLNQATVSRLLRDAFQ